MSCAKGGSCLTSTRDNSAHNVLKKPVPSKIALSVWTATNVLFASQIMILVLMGNAYIQNHILTEISRKDVQKYYPQENAQSAC